MRAKSFGVILAVSFVLMACSFVQGVVLEPTALPETESTAAPALPEEEKKATPTLPSDETKTAPVLPAAPEVDYEWTDVSPAPDQFTVVQVGQSKAKLLDILEMEAKKAAEAGRKPYVEFYADWCPPCNAIREYLGDELMVDAFAGTYIIQLDYDFWKKKLAGTDLAVAGIPAFYEIDPQGKPTGRMITGGAWGEDIPVNIAPPLKEFFNAGSE